MPTFYKQVYEGEIRDRQIDDSIFDISNCKYLFFDSDEIRKESNDQIIKTFQEQYSDWCYANPDGTGGFVFLSSRPPKLKNKDVVGTGFNYGSCNIIQNCPSVILIVAEND